MLWHQPTIPYKVRKAIPRNSTFLNLAWFSSDFEA